MSCKLYATRVIFSFVLGWHCSYPSSLRGPRKKMVSSTAVTKPSYSVSKDDCDTVGCFFIANWQIPYCLPAWNGILTPIVCHSDLHSSLHLFHQLLSCCWLMGKESQRFCMLYVSQQALACNEMLSSWVIHELCLCICDPFDILSILLSLVT